MGSSNSANTKSYEVLSHLYQRKFLVHKAEYGKYVTYENFSNEFRGFFPK